NPHGEHERRGTPTAGGQAPAEFTDASRGIRLQKALAQAGVASRRAAEELITSGRVTVNGHRVASLPAWVDPARDRIDGAGAPGARPQRPGHGRASATGHVYVMLHKPRRVISTTRDDAGRQTVIDLVDLPSDVARRVFPVGRLDVDSTGLMLLTNVGE